MNRRVLWRLGGALTWLLVAVGPVLAHEVRPAYLELREGQPGEFRVLWKTPMRGDARLALLPEFSGAAEAITPVTTRRVPGAAVQEWALRAGALRQQTLRIRGLETTMTDVLVRIEFADGTSWTQRLTSRSPAAEIPAAESPAGVALLFLQLGVEHILMGTDHLLFVFALILAAQGGYKLVKTVTAFTVAHGVTLSAASLDLVQVPAQPVEAVIALSVVFVAAEILHARQGRPGLSVRAPWIVAFAFGLLHGLGFASALGEVGLPQLHVPLALLFFSLGVEVGHLLVIGVVLSVIGGMRWLGVRPVEWVRAVPLYAIGGIAAFWLVQRIAEF